VPEPDGVRDSAVRAVVVRHADASVDRLGQVGALDEAAFPVC
jgi:hypothetical protein